MQELSRLLARFARKDPRIVIGPGIGRDATVISFSGKYLVAKTDPITFATDQIGWYAVEINANDIAVMGGIPKWFLATLLLPKGKTGPHIVREIFGQISRACKELGVVLCGGHTEITPGLSRPIVVGQMLGEVEKAKLVSPERIRKGDEIILTKGIAVEGTSLLAREERRLERLLGKNEIRKCRRLLLHPGISVVREARIAGNIARVHAMHDPTEGGLATGIHEWAAAANVGLKVEMKQIQIFPETEAVCRKLSLDPLGLLAAGALLIAVAKGESEKVISALKENGISASVIGKVWEKRKGVKLIRNGRLEDLPSFNRDEAARILERRRD